jgi:hypothetical protein
VKWVMWNLISVHLETVLASVQDRCMVCATRSIGSKILLDTPMVLVGDEAHVEAHFGPFGERVLILTQDRCTVCAEHTIGSEITMDVPNGTPR